MRIVVKILNKKSIGINSPWKSNDSLLLMHSTVVLSVTLSFFSPECSSPFTWKSWIASFGFQTLAQIITMSTQLENYCTRTYCLSFERRKHLKQKLKNLFKKKKEVKGNINQMCSLYNANVYIMRNEVLPQQSFTTCTLHTHSFEMPTTIKTDHFNNFFIRGE